MKVKIGNYPNRLTCRVFSRYMNKKYGYVKWPTEYSKFETVLEKLEDRVQDLYNIVNRLYYDRLTQKVKVRIDPWDTWSMDSTLAHIILPMLKQLKETKHGSQLVDIEDVPKELQGTSTPDYDAQYTFEFYDEARKESDVDYDLVHKRWDWVLDQMIFAFECKLDDSWEKQFERGVIDFDFVKLDNGMTEMVHGKNHTYVCDYDAKREFEKRIDNGFRLFGKYFQGLWD